MPDELEHFGLIRRPNPERPLQGMTVLVVEDSRFASEAIRLLCLRSGARIRRADTLAAAHRHLGVYCPSIVIIDLGLPDGCGVELIAELAQTRPGMPVIFAMSGDESGRQAAMAAGADGFFAKPIESLFAFQQALLARLPADAARFGPRPVAADMIRPDPLSLKDDLIHVAQVIDTGPDGKQLDYIAQFLTGVAKSAHDGDLRAAAEKLAVTRSKGARTGRDLAHVAGLIQARLAASSAI